MVLAEGYHGKDLYESIKLAGDHGSLLLNRIGWNVLITNLIAFAFASMSFGAPDHRDPRKWAVLVEDFWTADPTQIDNHTVPEHDQLEKNRVAPPVDGTAWYERVVNFTNCSSNLLGEEHRGPLLRAARNFLSWHLSEKWKYKLRSSSIYVSIFASARRT